MRRRRRNLLATLAVSTVMCWPAGDLWAQRLPPPDSSRPPRLVLLPPDSIRLHVRHLRLMELLSGLQRGDSAEVDAALSDVQWSSLDLASRSRPECRTVGSAVAALAARLNASNPSQLLPVFFGQAGILDSADVGLVTVPVAIAGPSGRVRTETVRLVYRDFDRRWVSASGLLAAVCERAAEPRI